MADEKVTEKPTLDGPKPDAKAKEPNPQETATKMLETLEKLGIKDEEHMKGIVQTAQKFGPQAQELGQVRQLLEEMKRENESLRAMRMNPNQSTEDYYGHENNVDLTKLVYENQYKAMRDFYQKEVVGPQQRLQQQYFSELNDVQNDDDYDLVRDVFTEHINSPQIQNRIATGQTSVSKEYDRTVRKTYRNYLKQTQDALKGVIKPGDVRVPNVESQTQQPVMPTSDEEQQEMKTKIVEARKAGTISPDQAMDLMVKAGLKADPKDPFFQRG